jgi:ABC-type dipeptide/oligopeptide/nickel transport system permease component
MLSYILRKLAHAAFVELGVVTLAFGALRLSGDPAAMMAARRRLGGRAGRAPAGARAGSADRRPVWSKKRRELSTEATQIIHEEKPWLELFREVIVYGVARRVTFKPRADYRLIVAKMTVAP